jgi:hypothetical protein
MDERIEDTAEMALPIVKLTGNIFGGLTPQIAIELRDAVQPGERVPIINAYDSGELLIYERTNFKSSSYKYPAEWDGISEDERWFTHSKSKKEYYIYTVEELVSFRRMVNAGHSFEGSTIHLANDINLSKVNWQPIGTDSRPFKGIFNGDGHCIHNLNIGQINEEETNVSNYGFFGCTDYATICDVIFDNARVVDIRGGLHGIAIVCGTAKNTTFRCISTSGLIMGNVFGSLSVYSINSDFDRCINRAKFYAKSINTCSNYVCGGFTAFACLQDYICPEPRIYFPLFERCINEGTINFDGRAKSSEVSAGQLYGSFITDNDDVKFIIDGCTVMKVNTADRKKMIPSYNGIDGVFKQRLKYGCTYKTDLLDGYLGRTPCNVEIIITKAVLIKSVDHMHVTNRIATLKSEHGNTGFTTTHIFDNTAGVNTTMEFLYPYYKFVTAIEANK